ncbi:MAG TPA: SpoIIE family protein phosphatase [Leptospiraceae bacterium]|nr:SpoIIE family protein phosphatase [Leptospiraceae bacterium]HNF26686.1 SpoIIE family protein phosphatase [Leptospiraceae bacterium]HNI94681.1 SpoIIE family protein phosphatase [Leptospiraceae bacterium]HNM04212.1 SpoIIE family protein phosphatase [Leptospiraceae bacterium]HNN04005.1 SpoIIE family protein phosphatase [Leptospiraceae bacterium]
MIGLRNKLIIGFIVLDIFLSIVLGLTMYTYSIDMFISDFRNHKMSIARFIANSIKGEEHRRFSSFQSVKDTVFLSYYREMSNILRQEATARYIYTLNYDRETEALTYGIDANPSYADTVWAESEAVSFYFIYSGEKFIIDHDKSRVTDSKEIIIGGISNILRINQDTGDVFLNDKKIFGVINRNPLQISTESGRLDRENRKRSVRVKINSDPVEFTLTFTEKDMPGTDPGAPFIEKEAVKNKIRRLIRTASEYIDEEPVQNAYGYFLSSYAVLKDSAGNGIGIVIVDIDSQEISEFKNKFTIVAISISTFTFVLTIVLSLLLAKYFTLPLEVLTKAVDDLASGNMETIVDIKSKDEFGKLAKSFNAMVNNLKIASEVQFNLITEISQLNDSLEKKVQARTKTIQAQSQELEKQILIAKKIQIALLPEKIPKIDNASVSFKYEPMMGVGGDFLDFYYRNENELNLFICDVSGHGVPAAFLASMVKMSLQECYERRLSPADALGRLHKSLKGKLSGHFISAAFCSIDLSSGIMRSASAGHLPLIHLKAEGYAKYVFSKGKIISELCNPEAVETVTELKTGDKIILYTDGITEARNKNNEMFGDERLLSLTTINHRKNPLELSNLIFSSVLSFTGNESEHFADDITILIAEYSSLNGKYGPLD